MREAGVDRLDWCDPVGVIRQLIEAGAGRTEIAQALGCSGNHVRSMLAGEATYIAIAALPRLRVLARQHLVPAWPWPTLASVTQQRLDDLRDARVDWMRATHAMGSNVTAIDDRRVPPVVPNNLRARPSNPTLWQRLRAVLWSRGVRTS